MIQLFITTLITSRRHETRHVVWFWTFTSFFWITSIFCSFTVFLIIIILIIIYSFFNYHHLDHHLQLKNHHFDHHLQLKNRHFDHHQQLKNHYFSHHLNISFFALLPFIWPHIDSRIWWEKISSVFFSFSFSFVSFDFLLLTCTHIIKLTHNHWIYIIWSSTYLRVKMTIKFSQKSIF